MTRRDDIAALVAEWKETLAELNLTEPRMNHHQLLMLVAEEILDPNE